MRGLAIGLLMVLRVAWLVNIVLGILFWTGRLIVLTPLHMLVGLLIAVLLLALGILAGVRGAPVLLLAAVVVAIALPVVGVGQESWLPGGSHWVIQVLHVLVALIAIAVGEAAGGRVRRAKV